MTALGAGVDWINAIRKRVVLVSDGAVSRLMAISTVLEPTAIWPVGWLASWIDGQTDRWLAGWRQTEEEIITCMCVCVCARARACVWFSLMEQPYSPINKV